MSKTIPITNTEDLIDSREVIERIEYLTGDDLTTEEAVELAELEALAAEGSDYAEDWPYGETLIRDSYFEEYAQQLAEDCCELPSDGRWPLYCIDWKRAARELQFDYNIVDFGGVDYWIRSC